MNLTPRSPSSTSISDFLAGFQEQFLAFIERTELLGHTDDPGFLALQQGLFNFSRAQVPLEMLSREEHEQFLSWTAAMDAYDLPKMQELRGAILRGAARDFEASLWMLAESPRTGALEPSDKIVDKIVDKIRKHKQTRPE